MSIIQSRLNNFSNIIEYENIDDLLNSTKYDEIVWLKIENTTFTDKQNFFYPKKIQYIYINNCKYFYSLNNLPEDIIYIDIINCNLINTQGLFSNTIIYNKLETVNLSKNRLTEIPENLPICLISLNLSENCINKLPDKNIFSENIRHINLSFNRLKTLPEWFLDLNDETTVILISNLFWFISYTNISYNKKITEVDIEIARRFFDNYVVYKLIETRNIMLFKINNKDKITQPNEPFITPYNSISKTPQLPNIHNKTTAEEGHNVHNSSIQDSFSMSVKIIMDYKKMDNSKFSFSSVYLYYLSEDFFVFNLFNNIRVNYEISNNCKLNTIISKCGITYRELFEKIWNITETHKHKHIIRRILKEEILDGANVCFTGKITRLVNALCGFLDGVIIAYNENEQINNAVISVMRRCDKNKELNIKDEIKKTLIELEVPIERHNIWLNALE